MLDRVGKGEGMEWWREDVDEEQESERMGMNGECLLQEPMI